MEFTEKELQMLNTLTSAENIVLVKAIYRGKLSSIIALAEGDNFYPMAILVNEEIAADLEPEPEN